MAQPRRLFVAIFPPRDATEAMVSAAAGICPAGHRFISTEQVHLTAQFIGATDPRELRAVRESVASALGGSGIGPFDLTPLELRTLPENARQPARLLAAITDAPPTLLELHKRLAHRLANTSRRERERFLPHFTLVRFNPARGPVPHASVPLSLAPFRVGAISLMESRLRPTGSAYTEIERFQLSGHA